MKKRRIELLLLLITLLLFPTALMAQDDMSFGDEEVEEGGDDMSFGEGETEAEPEAEDPGAATGLGGDLVDIGSLGLGGGMDDPTGADPSATGPKVESKDAGQELLERHPVWALQQVYALRKGRVDFQPSFGVSMNDPYVQHQSFSLSANYYITEVLGVGASFNWYQFLSKETDVNFSVSRATHQTVPINDYQWGGQLNMTYVPLYGKFALLKNWIVHWDVWLIGGGGFIFTKPIPVIDPDYREFDYEIKFSFNVGLGGRIYLTRFLAVYVELRDYIFPEKVESLTTYSDPALRSNEDTWLDDDVKLTNNVMLQFGVSLFLPFTFDFKLPK